MRKPLVIGLDLGRKCGIAIGRPGEVPSSCTHILGGQRAPLIDQCAEFLALMKRQLCHTAPNVIVAVEAAIGLETARKMGMGEATLRSAYGLHGVLMAVCGRYCVAVHPVLRVTVLKHFTGKGRYNDRSANKIAVISRCISLGYLPRDCRDEDRADAVAVWSWAEAYLAKTPPRALVLFGEGEAA